MKKTLYNILFVGMVFCSSFAGANYDYFFPIPVDHFYKKGDNQHLSLQLNCLKLEKREIRADSLDPSALAYCKYFMKFVPSPRQRRDFYYYGGDYSTKMEMNTFFDRIAELTSEIYKKSNQKDYTLKTLQALFQDCEKNGKTEKIRRVCSNMLSSYLSREIKKSKITLPELVSSLSQAKILLYKKEYETLGHFTPLDHRQIWPKMFMIGDYLFAEAYDSWHADDGSYTGYNGLRILKAGDTHWQEFAKLTFTDPQNYGSKKELKLINHKLNYYIWTFTKEPGILLISQYELQKNGDWKLKSCKEELSYNDGSVKTKAPNLDSCNRVEITLETTLGQ